MDHVKEFFKKIEENYAKDLESLSSSRFSQEVLMNEDLERKTFEYERKQTSLKMPCIPLESTISIRITN